MTGSGRVSDDCQRVVSVSEAWVGRVCLSERSKSANEAKRERAGGFRKRVLTLSLSSDLFQ